MSENIAAIARSMSKAERVVFLTGAGLSVASGISPYRKSKDAVWSRFITEWGTIERFHEDPLSWWREFWLKAHGEPLEGKLPNAGHHAITAMLRPSKDLVITQNIDGLHRLAQVPEEQLVEIHGRHDRFECITCHKPYDKIDMTLVERGEVPKCQCGSPIRPVVLLFDEMYDSHPLYNMRKARRALNEAEVIVFVGTSFSVGITDYAVRAGVYSRATLVNVNIEPVNDFGVVNVLGPSEVTLPQLRSALQS